MDFLLYAQDKHRACQVCPQIVKLLHNPGNKQAVDHRQIEHKLSYLEMIFHRNDNSEFFLTTSLAD
jgi:hypothetical protein